MPRTAFKQADIERVIRAARAVVSSIRLWKFGQTGPSSY